MNLTGTNIPPIVKVVTVSAAAPEAFRIFTARFGRWWPLATHSVGRSRSAGVSFGRAVGEPIVEMLEDGSRTEWGTILTWLPPDRVAFTWHPGEPEEQATMVEVTFVPQPEGGTRGGGGGPAGKRRPSGAVGGEKSHS